MKARFSHCMILLVIFVQTGCAVNYVKVSYNPVEKYKTYVDTASISYEGDRKLKRFNAFVTYKSDPGAILQTWEGVDIKTFLYYKVFDCKARSSAFKEVYLYATPEKPVIKKSFEKLLKFESIQPNTAEERQLNFICKTGPDKIHNY